MIENRFSHCTSNALLWTKFYPPTLKPSSTDSTPSVIAYSFILVYARFLSRFRNYLIKRNWVEIVSRIVRAMRCSKRNFTLQPSLICDSPPSIIAYIFILVYFILHFYHVLLYNFGGHYSVPGWTPWWLIFGSGLYRFLFSPPSIAFSWKRSRQVFTAFYHDSLVFDFVFHSWFMRFRAVIVCARARQATAVVPETGSRYSFWSH